MNYPKGSLGQIKLAAQEYEDIYCIVKDEDKISHIIIFCKPDYDKTKIEEFATDNLTLGVTYSITTLSEDQYYEINALKESMELACYDLIQEKTLELMKANSVSYGEAYPIATRIVMSSFKNFIEKQKKRIF